MLPIIIIIKNTPNKKHGNYGSTYAACCGETVTNLGVKSVQCLIPSESDNHASIHKVLNFQVGDLVTRGLLAVSQLCDVGAGVWLGPGPEFKSYIVWDKNAFIAVAGPKSQITF